jgi:hypothetical protein
MNPAPATQHNQRDRTSEAQQASESHLKRNLAASCRDDTSPRSLAFGNRHHERGEAEKRARVREFFPLTKAEQPGRRRW